MVMKTHQRFRRTPSAGKSFQRGLSIVELMVGMTVGLVISGMAGFYLVGLILENKNVVIETRLMQDMRAALDVVARDLRRAGYDQAAHLNVNQATLNPHFTITVNGSSATYSYSKNDIQGTAPDADEEYGFKIENGVLSFKNGNSGYQALTDEQFTNVTSLTITPTVIQSPVVCSGTPATPPRINVRRYQIVMVAQNKGSSTRDTFSRELRTEVRVRNDRPEGSCV